MRRKARRNWTAGTWAWGTCSDVTLSGKLKLTAFWVGCSCSQLAYPAETIYQSPEEFLSAHLPGCARQVLWLNSELKSEVEQILDHPFPGIRVRYCLKDGRTAWILDEIGKTEPITSGIVVDQGRVERVRVLIFRESRGSEVHREVFVRQFDEAALEDGRKLDRPIDGITGATLSVWALTRQVKMALLLDGAVREKNDDD